MRRILAIFLVLFSLSFARAVPQELVFWHHYADPQTAQFWDDMAEGFNAQYPGIHVTIQYFPSYSKQHDAILSGLLNGTLPDVMLARNYDAALYQLSNRLVDLSALAQELDPADFHDEIWAQDVIGGQRLGVPLTRSAHAMYINMDALRELGYTAAPRTRDELREIACAFHEEGGWSQVRTVNPFGFDVPMDAAFFLALGYPLPVYEDGQFDFSGDEVRQTIQFVRVLLARHCAALTGGQAVEAQNRFASGQSLFYFDSSAARQYVEAAIGDYFAQPFDLMVVPVPARDAPAADIFGESLSILTSTPEREAAAWAWVSWLAQPTQMSAWAQISGGLPARRDLDTGIMQPFVGAEWFSEPNFAGYDLVRDEFIFTLRAILGATVNEESALRILSDTANRIQSAFVLE